MIMKAITIHKRHLAAASAIIFFLLCGSLYLLQLRLGAAATAQTEGIPLPIVMYHHLNGQRGSQGPYVISPGQLEKDLAYIQNKGYVTVCMEDLIRYVYEGVPLPEKPIVLTFDDGFESSYVYAYPLLQKYHMKGVLSVTGSYSDLYTIEVDHDVTYSYLNWEAIKYLHETGVFEIQNHSYNLHSVDYRRQGSMKNKGESTAAYQALLKQDLTRMQERLREITGVCPTTYCYPFGLVSEESFPVVREVGFLASLTCQNKINRITPDPECLYRLGRFNRPHGRSSEEFFKKILV